MRSYDTQVGDHYKDMKIQRLVINKNKMQFVEGNAIKYIYERLEEGGKQGIRKSETLY